MSKKEKADFFCKYNLDECRKRKSKRVEVRHQREAINKLKNWFERQEFPSGTILTLPTGSGKTFTAVRFLCKYPLSEGYKVLWLAHTHHLLEQAFFSFGPKKKDIVNGYEVGWILETQNELNIRVVSGAKNHFDVSQIKPSDDVVISTLQTMVEAYKNMHSALEAFLESAGGKLIVVFDEAHHAPAPSFRKLLIGDKLPDVRESLRERFPNMYLLGLTATPTYTDKTKSGWLNDIFPQKIIYQADSNRLILEKILAKPDIKNVKTPFKQKLDESEYKKLVNRYGKDLSQKLIKRLAENKDRNQYIVDTYNRNIYGKTIIFTDYIDQCEQINEYLQNKNKNLEGKDIIRSDVMYSCTDRERNDEILEQFKNDKLDVIVNVRMLTEGTDVPDVNTVFITRQTTSDILLTQMVGRALRGPRFGGTETANLVFFTDDWDRAVNWVTWDPHTWGPERALSGSEPEGIPLDLISIELMQRLIRDVGPGGKNKVDFLTFVPIGWYKVNFYDSKDIEETNELILVFKNNKENYSKFINALENYNLDNLTGENIKIDVYKELLEKWYSQFFSNAKKTVSETILTNLFYIARHMAQNKNIPPLFIEFKKRNQYDIDALAGKYMKCPRDVEDRKLREIYYNKDMSWNLLYPDYDHFKTQYNACVEFILSKGHEKEIKPILTEEDIQIKKLKEGNIEEKVEACKTLGKMAKDALLHESSVEILLKIVENDENNEVKEASEKVISIVNSMELDSFKKQKVKQRDGNRCLCCGEKTRYVLQVDHIRPRWIGVDNSEDNLQTLCNKCNGIKGRNTIDFRKAQTSLKSPPQKFPKINEIEYEAEKRFVKEPEWWKKVLKRAINFFYQCSAVKSINIGKKGIYFHKWEVNLNEGNDPRWIIPFIRQLTTKIRFIRKSHGLSGPDNICVISTGSDLKVLDIIQKLEAVSVYERRSAATKVGNLKIKEAVPLLIKALDDKDRYVPRNAASSLGKIGDERATESLIKKLKSEDSELRQRSKTAIVKIGQPAILKLIPCLKNSNVYVRQLSTEIIGLIGDRNITEYLIQGLNDSESTVRWRAARALGNIGDINAIVPLKNVLNDADKKVREEVQNSLKRIQNDDGLYDDRDYEVKMLD